MGIDFKEDNTVNPPPQRMVHHTNHDKEFIKRKKRNVHFVLCLRNLIKLQGDVWHGYLCTQTVSTAEQLSALQEGAGPWALLLRTMAKLQSNGTPTLNLPLAPSSLCLRVLALQDAGGLWSTWPSGSPGCGTRRRPVSLLP